MLVDAPPAHEDCMSFVQIDGLFRELGVHSPEVLAVDYQNGFMLLEDLGEKHYQQVLNPENQDELYTAALETIAKIQTCSERPKWMANYSASKLREEMLLFPRWFVKELLGFSCDKSAEKVLDTLFCELQSSALEQPRVVVHRDFHVRNLMHSVNPPGVIDFQDAVWGPITYDLASLLRDCYIRWPAKKIDSALLAYQSRLERRGVLDENQRGKFRQWFDLMGLQRHIKVLGIFARLALRDGKQRYLQDLPLVIRYTLEVVDQYPQFAQFSHWFREELVPLAELQSWYNNWEIAGDEHLKVFAV